MRIPFYKPSMGAEEIGEVVETLKSGWLTTGPRTKQFEREFAAYLHEKHAVAVNSCTAALHLALEAIGLQAGQGVVVPTMTFAATAEVVRYLGGRPILADCRVEDFNLDVTDAERRIEWWQGTGLRDQGTKGPRDQGTKGRERRGEVVAIIPVHYGGQVGDVAGVQELAKKYGLKIIEDAAHCCPAYYKTKDQGLRTKDQQPEVSGQWSGVRGLQDGWLPVGAGADISCFSFYANKCITTGEGGMACTNSDEYADRMRIMSLHGISRDAWKRYTGEGSWYYEIIAPGYKYNLTDIAAAMGIHQLRKAELFHRRRSEIVGQYYACLKGIEEIILPRVQSDRIHSWHLFVIRLRLEKLRIDRAQFIAELQKRGIGTSVHWLPLHMHPYYRETYGYKPQDFPIACSLYPEIITLPVYPDMTGGDVQFVCDSIRQIVAANLRKEGRRPRTEDRGPRTTDRRKSRKQKAESRNGSGTRGYGPQSTVRGQ